jgi:hypothetical protein
MAFNFSLSFPSSKICLRSVGALNVMSTIELH